MKKPKAADRTVNMFSGKTALDEAKAASEELVEASRDSETIEQAAERWRQNAFYTQETMSKSYSSPGKGDRYRLTTKDGWMFLERFAGNPAAAWTGVMFPSDQLYEITNVFVTASKQRNESK